MALGAWGIGISHGQGLTLDFANQPGDYIQFNGTNQTFSFSSATNGYQWTVTGPSGSSALGLFGSITSSVPFGYGPISTSLGGALEQATVTGPLGTLIINDGTGNLKGSVNFIDVSTLFKAVGVFNAAVTVNVTGITYSGTNPDLQTIFNNQPATLDLSFQFSPGKDLIDLSTGGGPFTTSYSGSISVVPEPAAMTLSIAGGLAMLALRRRK